MSVTTTDALKSLAVDGVSNALARAVVRWQLSPDQLAVMRAVRAALLSDDIAVRPFLNLWLSLVPGNYLEGEKNMATAKATAFLEEALKGVTLPFDWRALLKEIGLEALMIVLKYFGITVALPAPKKACPPDCCDHHACACAVMASAWQTYLKAADHCSQCCDECC